MNDLIKLFDLIGELARRRYQIADQQFATLGLNHTEARLLTLLEQAKGEATQDALSNMLFIDRSNTGRGLKKLEEKEYIAKKQNEGDKRTRIVQITNKGRQTVQKIARLRKKIVQNFFGDLQEEDARVILELLQKSFKREKF